MNTATGLAAQISAFEPIANLSENGNDFADNGKDLLGQSNFCVPSEFLRSGYGPRTPVRGVANFIASVRPAFPWQRFAADRRAVLFDRVLLPGIPLR